MVLILFSSEKLNASWILTLALFGQEFEYSADSPATDIILEGQVSVLPGAAKMTFIVPKGGLEKASLQGFEPIWLPWPLERCKSCFNFPSRTNWSK